MRVDDFIKSRHPDWQALTDLLDRARRGIGRLSPADIEALGLLYRAATSDLALARRDFPGHRVTTYLNQLVARAHSIVYQGEPIAHKRIWRFIAAGFPRACRQAGPFIVVAALLLLLPALAAGLATYAYPDSAYWLLPTGVQRLIPEIEQRDLWVDIPVEERPYASSFIMQNNIQVAFLAFGGGVLAGLLTVYIMVLNGLMLGGITGLTAHYGVGLELWTFVIGHGVVELSVIAIAGGTGLMLGWAVIHPGLLSRRDALTTASGRAVRLLMGCVPLLIMAGLIEGFISPNEALPGPVKWGVGLGTGALLYLYLLLAGRERPR